MRKKIKVYKTHPQHLYWKDVESGDLLRIEPINGKYNVLHTIKNGREIGAWIYGFLVHPSYQEITQAEYEGNIKLS